MGVSLARRIAGKRSAEELQAIAAQGDLELRSLAEGEASASEVVTWVARNFSMASAAVACSMADAALPHLVAKQLPGVDVLFLDTGYHFAETLGARDEVDFSLDVTVVDVRPKLSVAGLPMP